MGGRYSVVLDYLPFATVDPCSILLNPALGPETLTYRVHCRSMGSLSFLAFRGLEGGKRMRSQIPNFRVALGWLLSEALSFQLTLSFGIFPVLLLFQAWEWEYCPIVNSVYCTISVNFPRRWIALVPNHFMKSFPLPKLSSLRVSSASCWVLTNKLGILSFSF